MDDGYKETYHLVWDKDRLVSFLTSYDTYRDDYDYEYSGKKGVGFFSTWHCEVMDSFTEDGLFIVHPELIGLDNLSDLPDRIIERDGNGYTEVNTLTYTVDRDGYVQRVLSEEVESGSSQVWKSQTTLTWR